MDRFASWLLAATIFLMPWGSVGVAHLVTGRSYGFGVQPAMLGLFGLVAIAALRWLAERKLHDGEIIAVVAMLWMVVATTFTWSVDDVGLAGDQPWAKSIKQLAQWSFFAAAALAVAREFERGVPALVERALGLGLVVACMAAVAVAFAGPGAVSGLDTNPSIASGSDELYLGHAFTGIARLRAPMPEPLMLGSYLLAVVPLVALSGFGHTRWARWWRWGAALLGAACLFATWSRGAWLGGAATGLLIAIAWMRGRFGAVSRMRLGAFVAAGAITGLAALAFVLQVAPWDLPALLIDRLAQSAQGHDMSNMTRVWAWRAAGEMFLDAPAFGHGWGSFGFLFFEYAPGSASGAHFGWPVPNNLALLLLAETGLAGFILWTATLAPALAALREPGKGVVALVVACAVIGVLVHFATFSQWNLPHVWVLFGAGLGSARSTSAEATCAS